MMLPRTSRPRRLLLAGLLALAAAAPAAAQETRTLDDLDQWKTPDADASPAATQLLQARQALARGDAGRALNLAESWLERYPVSPLRPAAVLVQGDALLAQGEEYKALFAYEDLIRRYPMSDLFVTALERELQIATAYAHGLKKKFFGTFRIVDAGDEAQELLIRIQERLPGSGLAEEAGMELADYYFRIRDMSLAATSYDLFVQNYPRSQKINKARQRLIASLIASFKGPEYDASGLVEATAKIKELQVTDPTVAQQIGAESLLVRIYESEAAKLASQSRWYRRTGDWISSERTIRRLVAEYPRSIAAVEELRVIPEVLAHLPERYVRQCPDYRVFRRATLGPDGDTVLPTGIAPTDREAARLPPDNPEPAPAEPVTAPAAGGST
ncbi:MAG: outer membrane protein assembly factor BamD [Phycisphaerales bacterium]